MDSKQAEAASAPLEYQVNNLISQTWFLKVSIHCEGCRRKVKKVLQSIDGVFTTTIDQQQQKVTVTGSVAVETLLRKLLRAGKHAEIWPENLDGNGIFSSQAKKTKGATKDTEKMGKNHSSSEKKRSTTESAASSDNKKSNKSSSSNPKTSENSPVKSPSGDHALPEDLSGGQRDGGGGGSGKKKKKKNGLGSASAGAPAHTGMFQFQNQGQDVGREMGEVNLSPTRQQPYLYTETGYPPMVYVSAYYNRLLYPMGRMGGPGYYVPTPPPSPYMCASIDQDSYQFQSRPLVSFEIFSDENANGCSIM